MFLQSKKETFISAAFVKNLNRRKAWFETFSFDYSDHKLVLGFSSVLSTHRANIVFLY